MAILFILFLYIGSLNTGWNPDSRCLGFEEQNLKVFSRCLKNFHVLNEQNIYSQYYLISTVNTSSLHWTQKCLPRENVKFWKSSKVFFSNELHFIKRVKDLCGCLVLILNSLSKFVCNSYWGHKEIKPVLNNAP